MGDENSKSQESGSIAEAVYNKKRKIESIMQRTTRSMTKELEAEKHDISQSQYKEFIELEDSNKEQEEENFT